MGRNAVSCGEFLMFFSFWSNCSRRNNSGTDTKTENRRGTTAERRCDGMWTIRKITNIAIKH